MISDDPLLPYLILPYRMLEIEDPEEWEPTDSQKDKTGKGWCQITKTDQIGGEIYHSRQMRRIHYIQGKLLPYFDIDPPIQYDFGFGSKKIDPLIKLDIPRMRCSFQNLSLPQEKTRSKEGLNLALKCIYRIAGYNDELFLNITRIYNQRIGIDLVKLIRFAIYNENHMPILDSQDAKLNLLRSRGQVYIIAKISGQIFDFNETERVCPVRFKVKGLYNISKDLAIHAIKFKLTTISSLSKIV